jgi:hypothetical protein
MMQRSALDVDQRRSTPPRALSVLLLGVLLTAVPSAAEAAGPLGRLFGHNKGRAGNTCAPAATQPTVYSPATQNYCWELRHYYTRGRCGRCVLTCGWFLVPCAPPSTDDPNDPDLPPDSMELPDIPEIGDPNDPPDLPVIEHHEDD